MEEFELRRVPVPGSLNKNRALLLVVQADKRTDLSVKGAELHFTSLLQFRCIFKI